VGQRRKIKRKGVRVIAGLTSTKHWPEYSEAAAEKAAEAARKKAEKEALLREEEASLPSKPKGKAPKAEKKPRGIDSALGSFETKPGALNASGIDNALDALDLTSEQKDKLDRHPERRFKAAYAQFEERRLEEMKDEKGLRRNQKIDQIRKEFEKHPDNPFNQVSAAYNASKDELKSIQEAEKAAKEKRLAGTSWKAVECTRLSVHQNLADSRLVLGCYGFR
jgi:hypothetical protein